MVAADARLATLQSADPVDVDATIQAKLGLDAAVRQFVEYRPTSIYGKLDLVADTHRALAARLRAGATPQEISAFISSLKSLIASLKEG